MGSGDPSTITRLAEQMHADRRRSGRTQGEVAVHLTEVLGRKVTRQAVGKWEAGTAVPDARELVQFASFTGGDIERLTRAVAIDLTRSDQAESPVGCRYTRPEQPTLPFPPIDLRDDAQVIDFPREVVPDQRPAAARLARAM